MLREVKNLGPHRQIMLFDNIIAWQVLVRRLCRVRRLKRLWANVGHHLKELQVQGRKATLGSPLG